MHSIFRELYNEAAADQDAALSGSHSSRASSLSSRVLSFAREPAERRVTLVWVARDRNVLELFGPTLRAAAADDLGGRFSLKLFVDSERKPEEWGQHDAHRGVPFAHCRPDCPGFIRDVTGAAHAHVFVCGPPGLAAACSDACLKHGVDFHSEVFAF